MTKLKLNEVAIAVVLGSAIGYTLYAFKKNKEMKVSMNEAVDDYILRENNNQYTKSYKRNYIHLGNIYSKEK